MDIDGVLIRGRNAIPGSVEAVRMLREAGVPYVFMTNGGGVTEAAKAKELADLLQDPTIDGSGVLLSHTPMRALADRYRGSRVVIVGMKESMKVAESYGFDVQGGFAVASQQIAEGTAGICPLTRPSLGGPALPPVDANAEGAPHIEAILVMFDPADWGTELQVLTDVLAGGRPLGSGRGHSPGTQAAKLYASNPDFLWQAAYPVPRYGQGAFLDCLRAVWRRQTGNELRVTEFGKPHASQFEAARHLIEARYSAAGGGQGSVGGSTPLLKRLYMVGDNPAADIRGANGAPHGIWRSVLVCTGVYRGGLHGNDPKDPAWRVEEDLRAAVERLLSTPDEEHLAS